MSGPLFPLYLKYTNNRTFFRVESPEKFEELRIMGRYYSLITFTAKIHPERVFILDMIENKESRWERIGEDEYNKVLVNCRSQLKQTDI